MTISNLEDAHNVVDQNLKLEHMDFLMTMKNIIVYFMQDPNIEEIPLMSYEKK